MKGSHAPVHRAIADVAAFREGIASMPERNQSDTMLLAEVAKQAIDFADPRIDYVTVQFDKDLWNNIMERFGGNVVE